MKRKAMVRFAFLLILLLIVSLLVSENTHIIMIEAKNKYTIMYCKATTLNIRKTPSTISKKVGTYHKYDKIKVRTKHNKDWYQVYYKNKIRYVSSKYISKKKLTRPKFTSYSSPSRTTFKSYEGKGALTNSLRYPQGRLKARYDDNTTNGVCTVNGRYCIAVGSYYTTKIGTKIDLVLRNNGKNHVLKCILADGKADKDTVNNHRVHSDGSVVEFVVETQTLKRCGVGNTGDVSNAGSQFKGYITEIRVYK